MTGVFICGDERSQSLELCWNIVATHESTGGNMPFINEYVSDQDIEKYRLRELNERYRQVSINISWTVDKEKDVYLRWVGYEPFESYRQYFSLYWKGTVIDLELRTEAEGKRGGKGSNTWFFTTWKLPENLVVHRNEILADLREALAAYKDFGIRSCIADHTAKFAF